MNNMDVQHNALELSNICQLYVNQFCVYKANMGHL